MVLRVLLAIVWLPGLVTIVIPALLLQQFGAGDLGEASGLLPWLRAAGLVVGAGGLWLAAQTIGMFARKGRGTLAPWDPPRKLVVEGVYRRVRNPMITGVLAILMGETLFFASWALCGWMVVFAVVNMIYIPLLEEPGLERRFGADYREYRRHVPRWIPRWRPWHPPWE